MRKLTTAQLASCKQTGRFAVAKLNDHHFQDGCITVPKDSRFVVKGRRAGEVVALFPHDTPGLESEQRVFTDGHVRIVELASCTIVGRTGG
jgi:hypothetical protein